MTIREKSVDPILTETVTDHQDLINNTVFSRQDLITSIDNIPKQWSITPVKDKKSTRTAWSTETPLSRTEIKRELSGNQWNGCGLRLGDVSGGQLAIDVDGHSAVILLKALESTYEPLPTSVTWTSGKDGRSQILFQIPDHYRDRFKDFNRKSITDFSFNGEILKCVTDDNGKPIEELDFRYNGHQSVLPPSAHPETGIYHWVRSPDDCKVAIAPDWLCDFILKLSEPQKVQKNKPLNFDYSIFEKEDKNILDEWVNAIFIDSLSWYEWRNLLFALHYEDYSETEALNISQSSSKHTDKGFYDVWNHIKDNKSNNITGGTLYHLATTYGNWQPKESDKKEWAKKQTEYKSKTLINRINKEGNLGYQLSQLLDKKEDNTVILIASIELAREFEDPIGEITEWVKNDFKNLPKIQISTAINIVAAIASEWGDKAIIAFLSQDIKVATGLPQINMIRSTFRTIKRELNPPKKDKEIKFDFIESRIKKLRFNELTKKVERDNKEYKNIELAYISDDLRDSELEISKDFAVDSILSIATKDSYHPVKDYLESIKNVPVLSDSNWNELASILLGATDELSQIILKKALIAAVARIYRPGCYMRMVAVLQGGQNKGKSTFLRLLAGDSFFCDSLGKLDNPKDDYQLLHSYWVHEWAELDKLTKKSSGDVKAFITKTKDDYRAPYARAPETHQRQCVIFGTCNRTDFLQDATGNTRYSVITIGDIDLEKTKEWRDRIWATAKAKFETGESWELTEIEQALSEKNNEHFTAPDAWFEDIAQFIEYRSEVSINEIFDQLGIDKSKQDPMTSKRVRDCLMILGWGQDKNATNRDGKRLRRYRPVLAQTTQQPDTVSVSGVSECVKPVSLENLNVHSFQSSDTLDTVKNKEITPPYVDENSVIKNDPSFSPDEINGKVCVKCVRPTQTQPQQAIHPDTVPDTVSVSDPVITWESLKAQIDESMQFIGWDAEKGRSYLLETYGVKSRLKLSDEQLIELRDYLATEVTKKRSTENANRLTAA